MHGRTRGQYIFTAFDNFVMETAHPIFNLVSITIDGAPSITGCVNGFIEL